jgi:hypothetical protein
MRGGHGGSLEKKGGRGGERRGTRGHHGVLQEGAQTVGAPAGRAVVLFVRKKRRRKERRKKKRKEKRKMWKFFQT